MNSGASHLEVPKAPDTAVYVKRGSWLMDDNPYSVKRARPIWSMTTFAYCNGISTNTQLGTKEQEIPTLQVRRLEDNRRGQGNNVPP